MPPWSGGLRGPQHPLQKLVIPRTTLFPVSQKVACLRRPVGPRLPVARQLVHFGQT